MRKILSVIWYLITLPIYYFIYKPLQWFRTRYYNKVKESLTPLQLEQAERDIKKDIVKAVKVETRHNYIRDKNKYTTYKHILGNPIFIPKRKKLKGWEKQLKENS